VIGLDSTKKEMLKKLLVAPRNTHTDFCSKSSAKQTNVENLNLTLGRHVGASQKNPTDRMGELLSSWDLPCKETLTRMRKSALLKSIQHQSSRRQNTKGRGPTYVYTACPAEGSPT
jgi:hypothetical protein